MSTATFLHLYRDTHLSTTMVYPVACDEASPRSPGFPSYFMAHFLGLTMTIKLKTENANKSCPATFLKNFPKPQ